MADLGSLIIRLGVDTSGVISAQVEVNKLANVAANAATKASASMGLFSRSTVNNLNMVAQRIRTFGYLSTAVLTAPIIAFGKASIEMAKDFEFSMAKIEGLAGIAGNVVGRWSGELKRMSAETGQAPQKLAEALYFVASSGFKTEEALSVTEASAKAAATGMGEAADVANMLVSALNAYKTSGLTASRAMDIFTAAVREGKIEPEAFASVLGSVMPVAAEAGVGLEQVTAAMAAMSLSGASAANAATYLRNILQKLMDPSAEVEKKLNEMGTTSEALRQSLAEQGLMSTLVKLRSLTEKYGETMFDLFPNIRALIGALNLTGENLAYNEKIFKSVLESTGDFNKAFEVASKTMQFQWNQALASSKVALIELGDSISKIILPFFKRLVQSLQNITSWFSALHDSQKRLIVTIAGVTAALGPLSLLLSALIYSLSGVFGIIGKVTQNFNLYRLAIIAATVATKGFVVGGLKNIAVALSNLSLVGPIVSGATKAVRVFAEAWKVMGAGMMSIPILAVAAGLTALITAIVRHIKEGREWIKIQEQINGHLAAEAFNVAHAFSALRNANAGTAERAEYLRIINSRYGEYLSNLLSEKSSLQDIADAEREAMQAMQMRIATQDLQAELGDQMNKLSSKFQKTLGDFVSGYAKMYGPEFTGEFVKGLNNLVDEVMNNTGELAPSGKTKAYEDFIKFYEDFIRKIAVQTQDAKYSFASFRDAFYEFLRFKKERNPIVESLQEMINVYGNLSVIQERVTETASALSASIANPVIKKIIKEMEQEERQLLNLKKAYEDLGISTEDVNDKLRNVYETASEELGKTGLKEAVPVISILQTKLKGIAEGFQSAGIPIKTLSDIMKEYQGQSEYLKYMAANARALGVEFNYVEERAKLLKDTLKEVLEKRGGGTPFAKELATDLQNLPADIYEATLAFKELREQFKYLEEKNKVTLSFNIDAEKLNALEEARDRILQVKASAKNLDKSFVPIGTSFGNAFGGMVPVVTLLDGWIQKLTKDIIEYTDRASLRDLEVSLRLLREQADAYGSVDNKLAVLSKDIQRTERQMYLTASQVGVTSQAFQDLATKLAELKQEYISLQDASDLRFLDNLYKSFGRYEDYMSMLEVQLGSVENKLRTALNEPPSQANIQYIQELTTEWGKLKTELEELDTVYDSLDSLSSIFQDIGDAIGGTTGEMISWIGELISRIPELIDLFNKYDTTIRAVTAATEAQTVAGQMSNIAKGQEAITTEGLVAAKGIEQIVTKASTAATNADVSAKAMDTAATLSNTTATGVNTAVAGANTIAKSTEAVAGATAAGAEEPFPYNIVAIALGVAAVIAALMTSIPKMKKGGKIPEGYPDDTYPAFLSSGEYVLSADKYKEYLKMLDRLEGKPGKKETAPSYSPKEMEIEDLTKRGSLPTGGLNDEFQLLLSTYENLIPEQVKKDKIASKIYNYNNVTEQVSRIPKTRTLSKETAQLTKYFSKLNRVSKESLANDKSVGYLSKISKGISTKYTSPLAKTKTGDLLSKISKAKSLDYPTKMAKNRSADYLTKLTKNKALENSRLTKDKYGELFSKLNKNRALDSAKLSKDKTSGYMSTIARNTSQKYGSTGIKDKSFKLLTDMSRNRNLSNVKKVQKSSDDRKALTDYLMRITTDRETTDFLSQYLTSIPNRGTELNSSEFLKGAFKDSRTNAQTLDRITKMKRTNDRSLSYLSRISKGTERTEKAMSSTKYLSSIAKLAKGGVIPKGYPRDSYPAMLSSDERVLPPQPLSDIGKAETNIHITLDGKISNRDIALVIRRIQEMN